MNRYIYDGATIAALPSFKHVSAWCSNSSATGKPAQCFLAAPHKAHRDPTKPLWLPRVTLQSTCAVLFLHFTALACLVMVTKRREPEWMASPWELLTPWAPWNPGGGPALGEPDTTPECSHSPELRLQDQLPHFYFPASSHYYHTFPHIQSSLLCFPHQHSWLWLHISSVSVSHGIKSMKWEFQSGMEGKIRNKEEWTDISVNDCNFWVVSWSAEQRKMQCYDSLKDCTT